MATPLHLARPVRGFLYLLVCACTWFCCQGSAEAQRPAPAAPTTADARAAAWAEHEALERTSPFAGLAWRSVGPVIQGGRVVAIESVPEQPFSFYVAYASGGLWRTDNNGRTFTPLFDDQSTIIMGDIAVAPSDPNTIWVGTGENNSSRSSYGGRGMFVSRDAGATWAAAGLADSDRIGAVVVDPRDAQRVYVAALGKLYTTGGERGVYRTVDGGATWECVLPGEGFVGAIDVLVHPENPDTLYAALWERSRRPWDFVEGGPGSGVFKSTDGGDTWNRLEGRLPAGPDVGRIGLALCLSSPETIYACVDNQALLPEDQWDLGDSPLTAKRLRGMSREEFLEQDPDMIEAFIRGNDLDTSLDADGLIELIENDEITIEDLIAELSDSNDNLFETDIRGLEVYRSDDGGGTWRRTHADPIRNVVYTYGYYFGLIEVAPDDPERIYVSGVPLITSTDGGQTFTGAMEPEVHVDHHALWIDPEHPQRLILGNDGGLDVSYDHGTTWQKIDRQATGQFYTVAYDMADPYNIYGGTQDNGTLKGSSRARPGLDAWSFIGGGDGMYVQVAEDGTTYYGYQFGFYSRRDPDGSVHTVRPRDALGESAFRYNWATPIQLSPHQNHIVYFGANRLHRSMDRGETWKAISPDLSAASERGNVPFACITTVGESPLEFGLLWAGTDDGQVHVTETGGVEWRDVGAGLPRDRWVSRVEPSRHVRERAYLTLNGYRDDDDTCYVYVTEDLGQSWRSLAGGIPAAPVNVIREDPVNENVLYVGTDRGAYVSLDRGARWHALGAGLPTVPVHDLAVHPRERELIAGTHGRSIYVLDALPIQELTPETREQSVVVFPLEPGQYSRRWRSRRSQWFHDERWDPERKVPFWAGRAGTAIFEVLDGDERVLRRDTMDVTPGVHVYTWDLLLDAELALAAEAARVAQEDADAEAEPRDADDADDDADTADADDTEENSTKGRRARTPWAEAVRLEHTLYITPGSYTVRITVDEESATTDLEVEAPEPRQPRLKPKPKIRGEKDH